MANPARIVQEEVQANGWKPVALHQSKSPRAEDAAVKDERRWLHELHRLRRLLEALDHKGDETFTLL